MIFVNIVDHLVQRLFKLIQRKIEFEQIGRYRLEKFISRT